MITTRLAQKTPRILLTAAFALAPLFGSSTFAQTAADQPIDTGSTKPAPNSISGRVVNQTGQPVANATISITRLNSASPARPMPVAADGSFKVTGLEPGIFSVTASAPGYVNVPRDPATTPASYYHIGDTVSISMLKGGVINGAVTDPGGDPVVAVRVKALMVRDALGQPPSKLVVAERQTDDRGIYRLYGLQPGTYVVAAGGPSAFGVQSAFIGGGFGGGFGSGSAAMVYDREAPVFSPSSTRDTAAEITVFAGEEINDVNIRYRAEPGHSISGFVKSSAPGKGAFARSFVILSRPNHGGEVMSSVAARGAAFVLYGVADGDYELSAQTSLGPDEAMVSLPRRLTVRGANVSGIVLTTSPLGSISGRVAFEPSKVPECRNKREPRLQELLVTAERTVRKGAAEDRQHLQFSSASGAPGTNGGFLLSKLGAGQYTLDVHYFAKYWYLRAIAMPSATAQTTSRPPAGGSQPPPTGIDVARGGISLKLGSRLTGVNVVLSEGAASLRGRVAALANEKLPPGLTAFLIPSEKEQSDNVLRFFAAPVNDDGGFAFGNLPPGRYVALVGSTAETPIQSATALQRPVAADIRARLRASAAGGPTVELTPCQNMSDFLVPLKPIPH